MNARLVIHIAPFASHARIQQDLLPHMPCLRPRLVATGNVCLFCFISASYKMVYKSLNGRRCPWPQLRLSTVQRVHTVPVPRLVNFQPRFDRSRCKL